MDSDQNHHTHGDDHSHQHHEHSHEDHEHEHDHEHSHEHHDHEEHVDQPLIPDTRIEESSSSSRVKSHHHAGVKKGSKQSKQLINQYLSRGKGKRLNSKTTPLLNDQDANNDDVEDLAIVPTDETTTEPSPKQDECKKGCCGDSKQKVEKVPIVTPQVNKSDCNKGCCDSKPKPQVSTTTATTDQSNVTKPDCSKKGCCPPKPTVEELEVTATPMKPDCSKKGCCPPKPKVEQEPVPLVNQQTKPDCNKGCCPPKPKVEEHGHKGCCPPKPKPVQQEDHGHKGCCPPKPIVAPTSKNNYCCEICIDGCCKSGCCKEECCVVYSFNLPKVLNKKKKSIYASLIYRTCGLCGIRFGSVDQEDEDQEQHLSIELLEKNKKVLYLSVTGMDCAECVSTLDNHMRSQYGVISITTNLFTEKSEITYSPTIISSIEIIKKINSIGFKASELDEPTLNNLIVEIDGDNSNLENIEKLKGISKFQQLSDNTINISFNPDVIGPRTIFNQFESNNMNPKLVKKSSNDVGNSNSKNLSRLFFMSCLFAVPVAIIAFIFPSFNIWQSQVIRGEISLSIIFSLILTTPIQFLVGKPLYLSAFKTLVYAKKCNMDLLIMISCSIAYFYSIASIIASIVTGRESGQIFFETSAILLTLIILGRYLESIAKGNTSKVLSKLLDLNSPTAILIDPVTQQEQVIDTLLIQKGDHLKVLPFSKVPIDGEIIFGQGELDQASITGESLPVFKSVGDFVYGSSMNQNSCFHIKVVKHPNETTIASICDLIEKAQSSKPPFQNIADKVASYFVPFILCLGVSVFFIWFSVSNRGLVEIDSKYSSNFTFALSFAMSVLVVSCPCAISLATPTAIMVGTGIASKFGILFKGGDVIESTHRVNTIVFDKTGTLTTGKFSLTYQLFDKTLSDFEFFSIVGSAESGSEHIIGKSILHYIKSTFANIELSTATNVETIPGKGLKCTVDQYNVVIGNKSMIQDQGVLLGNQDFHSDGKTLVFVLVDGKLVGLISLQDTIKPESHFVVQQLLKQNIDVWIVSGDNFKSVESVSNVLGIKNFISDASPQDKAKHIEFLQQPLNGGKKKTVAMIGDGVNDSLALVQSDVPISINNGTDIAMESSKVILMNDNLKDILVAIHLSKTIFKVIKINLGWAFFYNLIGIPIAAGLLYPFTTYAIPPAFAGLSELLSSLPVVLFSLLLNKYNKPKF
ncbi:hypothetical protein CYY_006795 [Polysphondylium violaceum]|uniref:P-type Cu(+) transporter n=1 Tax=Polysphondylium violaceum TaxID=133409 RepID=A0A8J4UYN6_9MYCE|nr:hypothetical protein CYY_006795 [Polysphondylium violaceum]